MAITESPEAAVVVANKKVAVIDDAFDDVQPDEITLQNASEFYFEHEDKIEPILERLQIPLPSFSDWDPGSDELTSFLNQLWGAKDDEELKKYIDHPKLFQDKLGKLSTLTQVCNNLIANQLNVKTFPSYLNVADEFRDQDFNYIFVDYNLGVKNGEAAISKARKVVQEIYTKYPDNDKPLAILMSSIPTIKELAEEFKKESKWLEGVFKSAVKTDLASEGKVSLLTKAYEKAYGYSKNLQTYIDSLVAASKTAQEAFAEEVKQLSIEDYEFIQNSVLNDEKHPLGDYLAWLYGSRWVTLLHRDPDLRNNQKIIDRSFSSASPLLHSSMPSEKLAEIFMTALFEDELEKLTEHPVPQQSAAAVKLPYLHLGDLLNKPRSKDVYLIINPQCDLERPSEKTMDFSILLLPGKLINLDSDFDVRQVKTDFIIIAGTRYKIHWQLKQVKSIAYREINKWIESQKLERKFRLRLPYALDLQQQYLSALSRVGVPVSPPISNELKISTYYRDYKNEEIQILAENLKYGFLQISRNKNNGKIRLTLDFALDFKNALIELVTNLKVQAETFQAAPRALTSEISKLEKLIADFDKWFLNDAGFNYPSETSIETVKANNISIVRQGFNAEIKTHFYLSIGSVAIQDDIVKTKTVVEKANLSKTPVKRQKNKKRGRTKISKRKRK